MNYVNRDITNQKPTLMIKLLPVMLGASVGLVENFATHYSLRWLLIQFYMFKSEKIETVWSWLKKKS